MITRRLLVRPAESFRSTESCPRGSTERPPRLENSPPPARQLSATSTTTLHHTAILRDPPANWLWRLFRDGNEAGSEPAAAPGAGGAARTGVQQLRCPGAAAGPPVPATT